ncbi:HEAT repeat domain-containing protein [Myroides sp. LJL116]
MKVNTENYKKVLKVLRLPEFWQERLTTKDKRSNADTLRVLDSLGENISGSAVSHKLYSGNKNVRKQAKSVFIKFNSNNAYQFLDNDFDSDFNALDQVRIHTSLCNKAKTEKLPSLIRWVSMAQNEKYQAFLVKEIGFFKQEQSSERLVEIYTQSSSLLVKTQIVLTLGELEYLDAIELFMEDYPYSEKELQTAIISYMGQVKGDKAISFLDTIYHNTQDKEFLVHILTQIHLVSPIDRGAFTKIKNNASTTFEKSLIAYVESHQYNTENIE